MLITLSRRACIADFGLATVKDSKSFVSRNSTAKAGGTMRWLAPELLSPDDTQRTSKASDIYAFACVCYEVSSPISYGECWIKDLPHGRFYRVKSPSMTTQTKYGSYSAS